MRNVEDGSEEGEVMSRRGCPCVSMREMVLDGGMWDFGEVTSMMNGQLAADWAPGGADE